jgi:hypothetical protein
MYSGETFAAIAAGDNAVMPWTNWPDRFRAHLARHTIYQAGLGEYMTPKVKPATISHWLTKRRNINLKDFFQLCAAAGADPVKILFGGDINAVARKQLSSILDSLPDERPNYRKYEADVRVPRKRLVAAKSRK